MNQKTPESSLAQITPDVKKFRSIEFCDLEKDINVFHDFLSDSESEELIQKLLSLGATDISIYILSHSSEIDSFDEMERSAIAYEAKMAELAETDPSLDDWVYSDINQI